MMVCRENPVRRLSPAASTPNRLRKARGTLVTGSPRAARLFLSQTSPQSWAPCLPNTGFYFAKHLMCDVEIPLSFLAVIRGGQPVVLTLGVHIFPECLAFWHPSVAFRWLSTEQKAPSWGGFGPHTLLEIWVSGLAYTYTSSKLQPPPALCEDGGADTWEE